MVLTSKQHSWSRLLVVMVLTEMCDGYVFEVKHLKQKVMPEGTRSGDGSKKKEVLAVRLLLIVSLPLRLTEVQHLVHS